MTGEMPENMAAAESQNVSIPILFLFSSNFPAFRKIQCAYRVLNSILVGDIAFRNVFVIPFYVKALPQISEKYLRQEFQVFFTMEEIFLTV